MVWDYLKDKKELAGLIGAGLGGILAAKDGSGGTSGSQGYSGGIPDYTYNRRLKDNAFSNTNPDGSLRRPGSAGRSYFDYPTGSDYAELTTEAPISTGVATYAPESAPINPFFQRQEMFTNPEDATQSLTAGRVLGADSMRVAQAEEAQRLLDQQTIGMDFINALDSARTDATAGAGVAQDPATPSATPDITPTAPAVDVGPTVPAATPTTPVTPTTTPIETDTTDTFSIYDDIVTQYATDGTYGENDPQTIIDLITAGDKKIGNVARDFNIPESTLWGNLWRAGAYTPAELADYIATTLPSESTMSNQSDYTEEDLIVQLLRDGQTTVEEVAEYYQTRFPGITPEQISANFAQYKPAQTLAHGGMLNGSTDGMADQIAANIDGTQPAALSDGEFVIPADVVSHLGNGNTDAGAQQLYSMLDRVRKKRTGTTEQGTEINPTQSLPA